MEPRSMARSLRWRVSWRPPSLDDAVEASTTSRDSNDRRPCCPGVRARRRCAGADARDAPAPAASREPRRAAGSDDAAANSGSRQGGGTLRYRPSTDAAGRESRTHEPLRARVVGGEEGRQGRRYRLARIRDALPHALVISRPDEARVADGAVLSTADNVQTAPTDRAARRRMPRKHDQQKEMSSRPVRSGGHDIQSQETRDRSGRRRMIAAGTSRSRGAHVEGA